MGLVAVLVQVRLVREAAKREPAVEAYHWMVVHQASMWEHHRFSIEGVRQGGLGVDLSVA